MTEVTENTEAVSTPDESTVSEVDTPSVAENVNVLAAFWSAVDAIDSTAPNYDAAVVEYEKLERGPKMKANSGVKAKVLDVLNDDNFTLAKVLSGLSKAIANSTGAPVDADPTEELVNRMAGIFLAYKGLQDANSALAERVKAAVDAANAGTNEAKQTIAYTLSQRLIETKMGRKPREGGGTRHNVGKHILEVFADKPEGTFLTVKQLSEAKSEEYGDDSASVVSIQQNLKNSFSENGFTVVTEGDKVTGVRKGDAPEA